MLEVLSAESPSFFSSTFFFCSSTPCGSSSSSGFISTPSTTATMKKSKKRKLSPQFDRVEILTEEPQIKKRTTTAIRTYYAPAIYTQHYSFMLSSRGLSSSSDGVNSFFHSEPNLANCLRLLPELCVFDVLPTEINIKILGHLGDKDYFAARLVCKQLASAGLHTLMERRMAMLFKKEGSSQKLWEYCAEAGDLRGIKWLHSDSKHTMYCTPAVMNIAARYGHLNVVKFLHEQRIEGCTYLAMDWAANYGHLNVVKFLHSHRKEGCSHEALDWAAARGQLEVVQWLCQNRKEGGSILAVLFAARNGHLDIVKWLHEHQVSKLESGEPEEISPAMETCVTWAAERGRLDVIKWFFRTFPALLNQNFTKTVLLRAKSFNQRPVLKWLRKQLYTLM